MYVLQSKHQIYGYPGYRITDSDFKRLVPKEDQFLFQHHDSSIDFDEEDDINYDVNEYEGGDGL